MMEVCWMFVGNVESGVYLSFILGSVGKCGVASAAEYISALTASLILWTILCGVGPLVELWLLQLEMK
jgi:hypothetical protein